MFKIINEEAVLNGLNGISKEFNFPKEDKQEEIVSEGLVFFKSSAKLERAARKLEINAEALKDIEDKKKMKKAATELKTVAVQFKKVEEEYKKGNKIAATEEYKRLLKKYEHLAVMMRKEDIKEILKSVNSFALSVASMVVTYMIISNFGSAFIGKKQMVDATKDLINAAKPSTDVPSEILPASFKKAGAAFLAKLPINIIGSKSEEAIENINNQEKIMQYVRKTFPDLA